MPDCGNLSVNHYQEMSTTILALCATTTMNAIQLAHFATLLQFVTYFF